MINLLIKKKILIRCFKLEMLYMAIREIGKLRDLGMVFIPSFKCLKNKKINLLPAILKLET
jgi:hypothetical protein